jgi:cyclopropane fatty-acyl-phospholipid synthase-like methyltransferase
MGPNVLWLTEYLCEEIDLKPGMRILDMGCGKALSSIFLAKEFGVSVVANDLWIDPTENWQRVVECGLEDRIIPIRAEAQALPYAERYFDAAICVDAYVYFGQTPEYAAGFSRYVKSGGQVGIAHTMFRRTYEEAVETGMPDYLAQWYDGLDIVHQLGKVDPRDLNHTLDDWKRTLTAAGTLRIEVADTLSGACRDHVRFLEEHKRAGFTYRSETELDEWRRDDGENFLVGRIVARVE